MSRKVLVVDDEKLIVKGIRFSLEQDGMDVDCAYDGEEALKLIRENKYNIILLDVMLPKLDGFQVCQQLDGGDRAVIGIRGDYEACGRGLGVVVVAHPANGLRADVLKDLGL